MSDRIVVFGAGATGRAHVGLLAWQAGFEVVFVDRNAALVRALAKAGRYTVRLYGTEPREVAVTGFRILDAADRAAVAREVSEAALVLTAVFDQNLADVAVTLAQAVSMARKSGRRQPLNGIACENMMDSSSALRRHVRALLDGADLDWLDRWCGFPDCMISRVVPQPKDDPLALVAEDYNEWTARKEAFRGPKPAALTTLELVENQSARLERKLFIHNGGHAICGYFGFHRGRRYIHEAVADPVVAEHVLGALDELGEVVRRKHGFSAESIQEYKQDLCRRGAVAEMQDEVLRVVRDPIRKLSSRERLVAPAMQAEQFGLPRRRIVQGIVAAMKYSHPADASSLLLQQKLAEGGVDGVLRDVCGIEADSALAGEIREAWQAWR